MARNKGKDPNKLGFGRLMAFKSSDIVSAWINLIMLNYLSIYASDTLGVNLLTVSRLMRDYDIDPEILSGHPALKSYNLGLTVTF
mgnify:CR=1 FL=1